MKKAVVPSQRQLEVICLCARGMTREEIARELHLSPWTVKHRIDGIRDRLDARSTSHAVTICIARGYLLVDGRAEQAFIPKPLEFEFSNAPLPAHAAVAA